jgi:uncharacterized protein YjbI with pentapeptide repeats
MLWRLRAPWTWICLIIILMLATALLWKFRIYQSDAWVLGGIAAATLGLMFFVLPVRMVPPRTGLGDEQLLKARHDVRTSCIQVVGGAVLLAGLLFTNRTLSLNQKSQVLTEQGQITDRFTHAIDELGSENVDIRLGGIYALEGIARDSKGEQGPVMEVLTAFVREHSPAGPTAADPKGTAFTSAPMTQDVRAILSVVARRILRYDPVGYHPDFSGSNLNGADLIGAELNGANFSGSTMSNATFENANLSHANLGGTYLAHLVANGTDLRGSSLGTSNLVAAVFTRTNLSGAKLGGADLQDSTITLVNLAGANLWQADLRDAVIIRVNFDGTDFGGITIDDPFVNNPHEYEGADLNGAVLDGNDLRRAKNLTQSQIDSAMTGPTTLLPTGIRNHN